MNKKERKNFTSIDNHQIKNLFKELLPSVNLNLYGDDPAQEIDAELLIKHLFFLCIITDRIELGKTFWIMGKVKLGLKRYLTF